MNPRLPCGLLLLCAVLACSALRAAEPLIRNGDFELADSAAPPPGWAMWGAQEYKNPANYTRDTTNPHGGQGCFRIYHPAGTSGYIVSHPDYAVPAQPGMMLTVTFWARTDRPGPSRFLLTAYESINPYRDAPSAGDTILAVDRDWKKFSFTVYEGWDYFADRSERPALQWSSEACSSSPCWGMSLAHDRRCPVAPDADGPSCSFAARARPRALQIRQRHAQHLNRLLLARDQHV